MLQHLHNSQNHIKHWIFQRVVLNCNSVQAKESVWLNLVSECLHYQVSASSDVLLLSWSSESVADSWHQDRSLKRFENNSIWKNKHTQKKIPLSPPRLSNLFFSVYYGGNTHKLLALEQVAVVHVSRRMLRYKAKDFGGVAQDGTEGDGGERAGVQEELRAANMRRTLKLRH